MKEIRPFLIAVSAIVSILCFPPFRLGPLIFITLVPLFLAVEDLPPWRAFKYGFFWGILFYFGLLYYIAWVTVPGMIATVLILSLIPATALWFFTRIFPKNRGLALVFLPSYFLTWNWLLTMSDLNYPWTDIGYALGYYTPLIQAAEIGGVYLISLFILAVNITIYASLSGKFNFTESTRRSLRFGSAVTIMLLFVYGIFRTSDAKPIAESDSLTIGLLQGNMTRDVKWKPQNLQMNFDRYFDLSREAVLEGAELLIWPETAIPTYLAQEERRFATVKAFVDSLDTPVLTGTPFYEEVGPGEYIYFNSAVLIKPDAANYDIYKKIHLVPMSEKIPYSGRFKILKEIRLGQADFSSGWQQTIFESNDFRFATVICFESAFPGYCREFAQKGAQFLVVITNDMWFGRTSLLEQHGMMSVFRAVENRIPVVRSANTGITMAVDKWGRILKKSDIFTRESQVVRIIPEGSRSVYGRIGNIIPQSAMILTLLSFMVAFRRRYQYNEEAS